MYATPVLGADEPATEAPTRTTTKAPPEERTRSLDETLPPHTVVLHNDEVNEMNFVVSALMGSVPELTSERAAEVVLKAIAGDKTKGL